MNLTAFDGKVIAYIFTFFIIGWVLNLCSYGYCMNTSYPISPDDNFYTPQNMSMQLVRTYLKQNDWIDERVRRDDVDYILQLAVHLSSYYDNIPASLAIATIAQESKFHQYDEYEGALGLMQLLPYYHRERLVCCLEEDERYSDKLFFDPRLNIMTGLDYLSQLIDECDGDIPYALMCYNQGPSSARKTYVKSGIVSDYAKNITKLSEELSELLVGIS